jgi:hypothetical protein
MQCSECEVKRPGTVRVKAGRIIGPAQARMGRLSLLYCHQCGTPLPPPDTTDTLLAKLSQLARFGLSAEDSPILTHRGPSHDMLTLETD